MNKSILILFLFSVIFLITTCGNRNSEKKNEQYPTSKKEIIPEIVMDSVTEGRYAYLQKVIESNSDLYIMADYVDYLTGKEAMKAEWRDKAYFVDGTDTISNITDGYYISNVNSKIRTFKISKNARIENIIDDSGSHKMEHKKSLNSKQLQTYIDLKVLLFIHMENGIVKSIDERFMP